MIDIDFKALALLTLRDPRAAAQQIIGFNFPRDVLWTGLALVALANTVIIVLLLAMSPPNIALPSYFDAPLAMFVLLAGTSVVYIHAIYWTGVAIGGKGSLLDVLALVVWLLVLRVAAQLAVVILTLAAPMLALLLSLVVSVWGFWIMLNFIAEALHLTTLFHAFAVLVIGAIGLVLGLGFLLTLIGLSAQGVFAHV